MRDPEESEERSRRRWLKWLSPAGTVALLAIRIYEALHSSRWHV